MFFLVFFFFFLYFYYNDYHYTSVATRNNRKKRALVPLLSLPLYSYYFNLLITLRDVQLLWNLRVEELDTQKDPNDIVVRSSRNSPFVRPRIGQMSYVSVIELCMLERGFF